jgi:hypothetical protein
MLLVFSSRIVFKKFAAINVHLFIIYYLFIWNKQDQDKQPAWGGHWEGYSLGRTGPAVKP